MLAGASKPHPWSSIPFLYMFVSHASNDVSYYCGCREIDLICSKLVASITTRQPNPQNLETSETGVNIVILYENEAVSVDNGQLIISLTPTTQQKHGSLLVENPSHA